MFFFLVAIVRLCFLRVRSTLEHAGDTLISAILSLLGRKIFGASVQRMTWPESIIHHSSV
jgi:hypothetical protein